MLTDLSAESDGDVIVEAVDGERKCSGGLQESEHKTNMRRFFMHR